METGSMLCAFFNKRITGDDAEATLAALFSPFWTESERYATLPDDFGARGRQWEVPGSWKSRAETDGTLRALRLLDFRINRLLGLLFVSDCWDSAIGLHLAHWLDTHMHLVIECERRKSGPPRECTVHEDVLRACDWRHERTAHVVAIREIFCADKAISPLGQTYFNVVNNMALCKARDDTLTMALDDKKSHETFQQAIVTCVLGTGPSKADFSLRKSVHDSLRDDGRHFFASLEKSCGDFPILFIALREFIVNAVRRDFPTQLYAETTPKWTHFSENVRNCGEMIRLLMRERVGDGDLFAHKLVMSGEEKQSLLRMARKVPGLFSRKKKETMSLMQVCRVLKRQRSKCDNRPPTVVEEHLNAEAAATDGMRLMRTLRLGEMIPCSFVTKSLRRSGERACESFVAIADAMKRGTEALSERANELASMDYEAEDGFAVAHTCVELMRQCESSFEMKLPDGYAEKQRKAAERRFPSLEKEEAWKRASELVWCDGCKCVKNFIRSGTKVEHRVAHGYKRVCRSDEGIMCFEKKRFLCCRTVPLRTVRLVDEKRAITTNLFGTTYVVSTCCGFICTLTGVGPLPEEPLCCGQCFQSKCAETVIGATETACRYCGEIVKAKTGYTGRFIVDGPTERVETLTFCKRHTRKFMRKDREPLLLEECVKELSKRRI